MEYWWKCLLAAFCGQRGEIEAVHIGIHTRWEILEDKLERREHPRSTKETWQLTRLPEKLSPEGGNRLFVAVDGVWQGYFVLEDGYPLQPRGQASTLLARLRHEELGRHPSGEDEALSRLDVQHAGGRRGGARRALRA